jgi:hypothetical protein
MNRTFATHTNPTAFKPIRTRGLYDPAVNAPGPAGKPFTLSRSKLEDFVRCPRCFYLDRRLGSATSRAQKTLFPNLHTFPKVLLQPRPDRTRLAPEGRAQCRKACSRLKQLP